MLVVGLKSDAFCRHDMKADIYAFGITLMEMAMGKPPYHSMGFQPMVMSKLNHDPPQLPSHHEGRVFSPVCFLFPHRLPELQIQNLAA